jgi:uncharacterized membrane protein (TIGR02234 family)
MAEHDGPAPSPEAEQRPPRPRGGGRHRDYASAALTGVAGAALAAVAGARTWANAAGEAAGMRMEESLPGSEAQPLTSSLALVALAAWGVLLVLRGRTRRWVAAIGLLACVGGLAAWGVGWDSTRGDVAEAVLDRGAAEDTVATELTAWFFLAGAGLVVAAAALVVAFVRAPGWPAMGSRYDAPAERRPATQEDMWRALDEGRDPTS